MMGWGTRSSGIDLKRVMDVVLSALGLLVLSPVLVAVAVAVAARLGRPVLFRQTRPGLGGEPFTLYKFRTLTDACDPEGHRLPDEQRLTRFGQWLRSTSLDELPELFNVLRGDMSLVGPRPLLPEYLPRYSDEQARRHLVRPGMTGWAQVNGRNDRTWEDKLSLDVWYVDHQGPWLDLRILLRTAVVALRGEGVSRSGHATTTPFQGSAATGGESPGAGGELG